VPFKKKADRKSDARFTRVGAFWQNEKGNLSGTFDGICGIRMRAVIFENQDKKGRAPDYLMSIIHEPPEEEEATTKKKGLKKKAQEEEEEEEEEEEFEASASDVPF